MTSATPHAQPPSIGIRLDVQMFMQRVAGRGVCLPTNVCVTWTHGPQRGCLVCATLRIRNVVLPLRLLCGKNNK